MEIASCSDHLVLSLMALILAVGALVAAIIALRG